MKRKERRARRKPMAEINVVPYIDVMLVLLVIFMVTAPLLTQGVKVDLPKSAAEPLPGQGRLPIVIHIDQFGDAYLDIGDNDPRPVDAIDMLNGIRRALDNAPETPVMVRADARVEYGLVVDAMVVAQAAGAASVGLMTQAPIEPNPAR